MYSSDVFTPIRDTFVNVSWRELDPSCSDPNAETEESLVAGFSYIASRGKEQLSELKRWIQQAGDAAWLRRALVHGATANNHNEVVQLLLDEVGCDVNRRDKDGWAPLHYASIWGRPGLAVLLLSRGAEFDRRSTIGDDTAFDIARARFAKLKAKKLDSYQDIDHLRSEGYELVQIFEGVKRAGGSYEGWARPQGLNSPHVLRYSPALVASAQRLEITKIRELILRKRASVKSIAELEAEETARKAALEAAKKAMEGPPLSLEEALESAGLLKGEREKRRIYLRQFKLLGVKNLSDLDDIGREDVANLDELTPAERREIWSFVQQHRQHEEVAPMNKVEERRSKLPKKNKSKQSKTFGELDALLAEGSSGVRGKQIKSKKVKSPVGQGVGVAEDACHDDDSIKKRGCNEEAQKLSAVGKSSRGPFTAVSGPLTSKDRSINSENSSSSNRGDGSKNTAKESMLSYKRHWPNLQVALSFVFREDLPIGPFSIIAKQLYSGNCNGTGARIQQKIHAHV